MKRSICVFAVVLLGVLWAGSAFAVCNNPASSYPGNVLVSGAGCVWNTDVTIGGTLTVESGSDLTVTADVEVASTLYVENGATLNINTTSTNNVVFEALATTVVHGTMNINSKYSGKAVHYWVGNDKQIKVYSDGQLYVDTTVSNVRVGTVYFWGQGLNTWDGIYGYAGSKIRLFSGTEYSGRGIFIYSVATDQAAVYHHTGTSTGDTGYLRVSGVDFNSGAFGVMIYGSGYTTQNYNSFQIYIQDSDFDNITRPIFIEDCLLNKALYIQDNHFEDYFGAAVYISDFYTSYSIEITNNNMEHNNSGEGMPAISLTNFANGNSTSYHTYINNNTIDGGDKGIQLNNWRPYVSNGDCVLNVENNTIDVEVEGVYLYANNASCNNSYLDVDNNDVTATTTTSASNTYGVRVINLNSCLGGSCYVRNNELTGYFYNAYLDSNKHYLYFQYNVLDFGSIDSTNARLLYLKENYNTLDISYNSFDGCSYAADQQILEYSGSSNFECGGNSFAPTVRTYPTTLATLCD